MIWIYLYLSISAQDILCNNTGNVSILAIGELPKYIIGFLKS